MGRSQLKYRPPRKNAVEASKTSRKIINLPSNADRYTTEEDSSDIYTGLDTNHRLDEEEDEILLDQALHVEAGEYHESKQMQRWNSDIRQEQDDLLSIHWKTLSQLIHQISIHESLHMDAKYFAPDSSDKVVRVKEKLIDLEDSEDLSKGDDRNDRRQVDQRQPLIEVPVSCTTEDSSSNNLEDWLDDVLDDDS